LIQSELIGKEGGIEMDGASSHWTRKKAPRRWLMWFLFLFVLDLLVPFAWLSQVQKITGAFLFWTLWTIVAIVSMFLIFLKWR
jgi:hypothetical protein